MEDRMWILIVTATIISSALLLLNGLMVWLYIRSNGRSITLTAAVRQLQRDIVRQAEEFRERMDHQAKEYDLKLAAEVEKWLDQRQRHWVTARTLMVARGWIRQLLDAMRAAGLTIPVPADADEIHVADESIHRAEIERAKEHQLDDLIELARKDYADSDAVTTDTGAP
jgi:transcriptional regulator of aromatic amino acid metabolism